MPSRATIATAALVVALLCIAVITPIAIVALVRVNTLTDTVNTLITTVNTQHTVITTLTTDLNALTDVVDIEREGEERYITTIIAPIAQPTVYIGVNLSFAYYYKKSEHQVRVAINLLDGYPESAIDSNGDSHSVTATSILPAWACHVDPLSGAVSMAVTLASSAGVDTTAQKLLNRMFLENVVATNGFWAAYVEGTDMTGHGVHLGVSECVFNYNSGTDTCLPDYVGEMVFDILAPVDITAWNAQWDAAV
jgi:hypothetical protein